MRDNTCNNCDNTRENNDNTRNKSCQLKLNDMNCYVNYHIEFDAQVSVRIVVSSIIEREMLIWQTNSDLKV